MTCEKHHNVPPVNDKAKCTLGKLTKPTGPTLPVLGKRRFDDDDDGTGSPGSGLTTEAVGNFKTQFRKFLNDL